MTDRQLTDVWIAPMGTPLDAPEAWRRIDSSAIVFHPDDEARVLGVAMMSVAPVALELIYVQYATSDPREQRSDA